ncbi:DNA binding protein [Senna tora]|uniref:DNA binding protein n=1 Tax=Senna tora TaxID=362788 RepID=A0A834X350_9FABA|nr:DNA binding protein [Senna tora]
MAPVRSTGFVDPGWDHGVAQDERKKKVRCNYCGKVVSGGIYRLKQHLARVSGEVTYCEKAPEEVYLKMKENLEGCRSNKKQKQVDAQAYMNFHSIEEEDEEEQRVGYRSKGKQLMIDRSVSVNLTPLRSLGYVDPGWEHGTAQDERKKKVKCNYCEKVVSGGINRFKQHLARIPGEVAPCKHAPEEVYLKIKENMKWHRTGRRHRRPEAKDLPAFYSKSDNEEDEDEHMEDALHHMNKETPVDVDKRVSKDLRKNIKGMSPSSGPEPVLRRSRLDSVFLKFPKNQTPQTYKQLKVKTGPTKKSRKEVISMICKFFYHAGVPLQAANSVYFHKMLEVVGQYGQGLVCPPSQLISGRFLQDEITTIKNYLVEYKASWAFTGCSIMADSWRDAQVDATNVVEDAPNLFKLLDDVVEDIGEENVVQAIGFGVEQDDECENDSIDYEDGGARAVKESLELVTMGDVGSLDVDHANIDAATDDESDLNYFDDDLKGEPVVGLSWKPKLPIPSSSSSKLTTDSDKSSPIDVAGSAIWKPNSELVDGLFVPPSDPKKLNKLLKKQVKDTAGKNWFDMPAQTITPELQKDLKLLKLRGAIDPKRHYKKGDSKSKSLPKYFQVGTVVASAEEFFSGRLTKKERKATLADELLSDNNFSAYRKRKVQEIEEKNRPAGNDKWKIKGRNSQKRKKERRFF